VNPFSFLTGLLTNLIPGGASPTSNITFTPAQFQALIKAAEVFGPMLMGISPQQMQVADELLAAFGYSNIIPKA